MTKARTLLTAGIASAVLLVGFSAHVVATSVTGQNASANVISPIVVTPGTALNFGSVSNSTAGTVNIVLDPTLAVNPTSSGDGGEVVAGTANRADFGLAGEAGANYTVDFTANTFPIDLSGDGTVQITGLTWSGAGSLVGGADTMYVGGNLQLTTAPTAGLHTSTYVMDVIYN